MTSCGGGGSRIDQGTYSPAPFRHSFNQPASRAQSLALPHKLLESNLRLITRSYGCRDLTHGGSLKSESRCPDHRQVLTYAVTRADENPECDLVAGARHA